jgi:hypothetical protein
MATKPPPPSTLLPLHAKAVTKLTTKTTRVRFPRPHGLPTLNIDDIYASSSQTRVSSCLPDLDLAFLFAHHNTLYRLYLFAYPKPSTKEDFDVARAIWFWGIGKWHNFMGNRDSVRLNIIMMLLLLARPELQRFFRDGAAAFMEGFVAAWLENIHSPHIFTARERFIEIWTQGEFELICFPIGKIKSTRDVLREKRKEVDNKGVIVSFEEDGFVEQMRGLSVEDVWDIGPAIAEKWVFAHLQAMHAANKQASGIEDLFGDFSIDDIPSAMNLELVDWEGELVSALLEDVDYKVVQRVSEKNEGAYWMDKSTALRILRSENVDAGAPVAASRDVMEE